MDTSNQGLGSYHMTQEHDLLHGLRTDIRRDRREEILESGGNYGGADGVRPLRPVKGDSDRGMIGNQSPTVPIHFQHQTGRFGPRTDDVSDHSVIRGAFCPRTPEKKSPTFGFQARYRR